VAKQIQSIERGLYILESIMFNKEPATATEIARQLGVHKSTVSHLTSTLIEQGYLCKVRGTNRLTIGPMVYRAGRVTGLSGEQIMSLPPALERLAAATGETAHLAELRGRYVIYLVNSYPEKTLRVQTETGAVEAAHSTAVGKALLAGLDDEEVRAMYDGVELEAFTDRTITETGALLSETALVRERGYAADRGEQTPGTGCVAAPVRDERGMVVGAVGISGMEVLVFDEGRASIDRVLSCAAEIEKMLKG
jgi:DNA-binding IclR family transcriptional regulator